MKAEIWVSLTSVVLYFSLAVTSLYFYLRLRGPFPLHLGLDAAKTQWTVVGRRRCALNSKSLFFLLLCLSSLSDVPFYIGCLSESGPDQCGWNNDMHTVVWSFHLVALFGYAVCLGIPLFLWSDVINGRDGLLFRSAHKADFTKKFLRLSVLLYFILEVATVVSMLVTGENEYFSSLEYRTVFSMSESSLIASIACVWLVMGIRLQLYVRAVRFDAQSQKRILLMVNLIMLSIFCCYLLRAVLLLLHNFSLIEVGGERLSYAAWVACTRWLPYIYCSFMLIYILQRSEGTPDKSNTQEAPQSSVMRSLLHEQETEQKNVTCVDGSCHSDPHATGAAATKDVPIIEWQRNNNISNSNNYSGSGCESSIAAAASFEVCRSVESPPEPPICPDTDTPSDREQDDEEACWSLSERLLDGDCFGDHVAAGSCSLSYTSQSGLPNMDRFDVSRGSFNSTSPQTHKEYL